MVLIMDYSKLLGSKYNGAVTPIEVEEVVEPVEVEKPPAQRGRPKK